MASEKMQMLEEAGFDTQGALSRLMQNESFYLRLLNKFLADVNFQKLIENIATGDEKASGESAHALKGVTATLGMTELSECCATLQNIYLGREAGDPVPVFARAKELYEQHMELLPRVMGA